MRRPAHTALAPAECPPRNRPGSRPPLHVEKQMFTPAVSPEREARPQDAPSCFFDCYSKLFDLGMRLLHTAFLQ